jgi:hypothetical protein
MQIFTLSRKHHSHPSAIEYRVDSNYVTVFKEQRTTTTTPIDSQLNTTPKYSTLPLNSVSQADNINFATLLAVEIHQRQQTAPAE